MFTKNKGSLDEELPRIEKAEKFQFPADQLTQEDVDELEASLPPLPHPDTHGLALGYSGPMPDPLSAYKGERVKLYTKAALEELAKKLHLSVTDSFDLARSKELIKILWESGEDRKLARVPYFHRINIDHFNKTYPNFQAVTDFIGGCCELALLKDTVMRITPILLSGPPGIGKTMYVEAIAKWLGSGFQIIRYDSAQCGSEISGSSSFWSNAQPGKIFHQLTQSEEGYGNPVFFLDEIDKAPQYSQYDPLGPLHGLLDQSAKHFEDLCVPLRIDASHVIYLAACNDPSKISEPLRSRFREFEIGINAEQGKTIAYKIVLEIVKDLGLYRPEFEVDLACFDVLAKHSPRRMKQLVLEAIGRALSQDRKRVEVSDLVMHESSRMRIGFMQ